MTRRRYTVMSQYHALKLVLLANLFRRTERLYGYIRSDHDPENNNESLLFNRVNNNGWKDFCVRGWSDWDKVNINSTPSIEFLIRWNVTRVMRKGEKEAIEKKYWDYWDALKQKCDLIFSMLMSQLSARARIIFFCRLQWNSSEMFLFDEFLNRQCNTFTK